MNVWLPTIRTGSGADVFSERLAEGLARHGVDAKLTWIDSWCELLPEAMRLRRIPAGTDLVHANTLVASQFFGRGVPMVVTVHHLTHDPAFVPYRSAAQAAYHRFHLRWRERRAMLQADAVTAVSRHVAGSVSQQVGRTDVEVVPNWVDCTRYVPLERPTRDSARFRVLWVGNQGRRKGSDLLGRLASALGSDVEVRCIGGLRTAGREIGPGVVVLDRLDEAQLVAEYQACDVLVSLSRYEGFGYTALEAMACGKPVVAFAAGGLVEVVADGRTGFLCPVGDLDAVAARLRQLAGNPALRGRFGQAGRERAVAFGDSVESYLRVYRRVLGPARAENSAASV